ncbi:hypothetical protein D3C87_1389770 [compost metagenome]
MFPEASIYPIVAPVPELKFAKAKYGSASDLFPFFPHDKRNLPVLKGSQWNQLS